MKNLVLNVLFAFVAFQDMLLPSSIIQGTTSSIEASSNPNETWSSLRQLRATFSTSRSPVIRRRPPTSPLRTQRSPIRSKPSTSTPLGGTKLSPTSRPGMQAKPQGVKPPAVKAQGVKPSIVESQGVKPPMVKPQGVKPPMVKPQGLEPQVVKPQGVKPSRSGPSGAKPSGEKPLGAGPYTAKPFAGQKLSNTKSSPAPTPSKTASSTIKGGQTPHSSSSPKTKTTPLSPSGSLGQKQPTPTGSKKGPSNVSKDLDKSAPPLGNNSKPAPLEGEKMQNPNSSKEHLALKNSSSQGKNSKNSSKTDPLDKQEAPAQGPPSTASPLPPDNVMHPPAGFPDPINTPPKMTMAEKMGAATGMFGTVQGLGAMAADMQGQRQQTAIAREQTKMQAEMQNQEIALQREQMDLERNRTAMQYAMQMPVDNRGGNTDVPPPEIQLPPR